MNLETQHSRRITQSTQRTESKFQILCARCAFFVFLVVRKTFETTSFFILIHVKSISQHVLHKDKGNYRRYSDVGQLIL